MVKIITVVPVNSLPIEEATPQVEDILKLEEATPQVEADIAKVEPEMIHLNEEMLEVEEELKPPTKTQKT